MHRFFRAERCEVHTIDRICSFRFLCFAVAPIFPNNEALLLHHNSCAFISVVLTLWIPNYCTRFSDCALPFLFSNYSVLFAAWYYLLYIVYLALYPFPSQCNHAHVL
ncbi:hypothetical protein T4C_13075 [Trichinella pseudospiralis]|uniref:Uncharacterized protein n=1 Tax=Trichinella pseudospiralis TaxID=6337 RepID=A0A0V1GRJ3_TRIPS|nr:hypothetical protein T4C_13075 [Trichinella pseudospiralis]